MAQSRPIISTIYPYLSIRVEIRGRREETLALLDTGFTGNLVVPTTWLNRALGLPDGRSSVEMGDGSITDAPVYLGTLEIVGLSTTQVRVTVLGNEYILGRRVLDRFEVTFDHGQRVIVRP